MCGFLALEGVRRVGVLCVLGRVEGAVAHLRGKMVRKVYCPTHPVAAVGFPAFVLCRGSRLVLFCRPRGFVPLSSSCPDVRGFYALGHESSTHVAVCHPGPFAGRWVLCASLYALLL